MLPRIGRSSNHHSQVLWTRGLLIRRNIANGDLAYFTTWCPAGTSIKTLVSVEGHRWAIEDSFETAKNEFGLDHNEFRSWHGWHRHVSLVMLGFAMMAAIQHQANKPTPKKPSRAQRQDIRSHPLVDPGNPPHSSTSRAKTHSTRRHHRMVALAARSSGRSTEISSQTKITTVMLGRELINQQPQSAPLRRVGCRLPFFPHERKCGRPIATVSELPKPTHAPQKAAGTGSKSGSSRGLVQPNSQSRDRRLAAAAAPYRRRHRAAKLLTRDEARQLRRLALHSYRLPGAFSERVLLCCPRLLNCAFCSSPSDA